MGGGVAAKDTPQPHTYTKKETKAKHHSLSPQKTQETEKWVQ